MKKNTAGNDIDLFQEIFNRYSPGLYTFCLRLTGDGQDAQDIVQEIFLKLWERRSDLEVIRNPQTYLKITARNLIYDMFRRKLVQHKHRDKIVDSFQRHADPEHQLDTKQISELIVRSAAKLTPQQREIMILKSKDFRNEEIAELLGLSKRTVEAHLNKAYRSLRNDLGTLEGILPAVTVVLAHMHFNV